MKLAYLMNSYPLISTTFILREIQAIEAMGHPVERFALRHFDGNLVDPENIAEQGRTHYIITGSKSALLKDVLLVCLAHPLRVLKLLPLWWRVWRNAKRKIVQHVVYFIDALAFYRRAIKLGVDHVHVHFSTNAIAVAMFSRVLGGPSYSFTVHGPAELAPGEPAALSIREKAHHAAFIVAITQYCRGLLIEEAPEAADKIKVILCGIDLRNFEFDAPPPDAARIICIGRLCENKGQRHIPPAVAQVVKEFPDLVVELIGSGEHRDLVLAGIEKHGLQDNVILLGNVPEDRLRAGILDARALLLPSYAEGLPMVFMEAFAVGRPVLTTRITGHPELVDAECGWMFQPGDEDAIAEALRGVMRATSEERSAMGREGRRRVEERHDVKKLAASLIEAFEATAAQADAAK
jgi:colanic acid/amylovoran biosynthesis glycosyltransferase